MIEFDGVTKRYPDGTVAVDDLSMKVGTGQITVFVGPSGCGKTTALRMINRMIQPTSGRILIDGDDVTTRPEAQLRREIGYVIQGAGLFPHRTVLDNVATVPVLQGTTRREARQAALGLLERVGLPATLAKRYPAQLSGGQQQRVGVARALAADPPVLLMDEPFSAVDPVVRDDLQQELLRLQGELGKTIVLVTHDIDEAIRLGDEVAVFAEGARLAQFASPADLLAAPADDFVASLVGRDRGFRGLSFADGDQIALKPTDHEVDGLRLETDADGRPLGWRGAEGLLPTEGSFSDGASLRAVTDLVILSPAGAAVRVDADGRADGLVLLEDIAGDVRARQRERLTALVVATPATAHSDNPPPAKASE
ncbi:osmoprotectant transport system ATP-binding protein [Nocardioides albertanoniae]|uniref:ABC-type quaternary amine transporter n=1 Tax=Nocardioides albertanoniae TaxID=1175486 RepID=A0A543A133_9ACTN|nr:ABC transporter ATP-binding protein [Nocardioides albertanoniae]TQL66196.1 osmoprotectant transport system ATP-binding protein [Nocardioides albertanoniae]